MKGRALTRVGRICITGQVALLLLLCFPALSFSNASGSGTCNIGAANTVGYVTGNYNSIPNSSGITEVVNFYTNAGSFIGYYPAMNTVTPTYAYYSLQGMSDAAGNLTISYSIVSSNLGAANFVITSCGVFPSNTALLNSIITQLGAVNTSIASAISASNSALASLQNTVNSNVLSGASNSAAAAANIVANVGASNTAVMASLVAIQSAVNAIPTTGGGGSSGSTSPVSFLIGGAAGLAFAFGAGKVLK